MNFNLIANLHHLSLKLYFIEAHLSKYFSCGFDVYFISAQPAQQALEA